MGTWGEVTALVRATARLWWRFLPQLLLWFWVGYAVHRLSLQAAAGFGANARVTANIFFGVALIATASGTIFMIHALGPGLLEFRRRLRRFRRTPPHSPGERGSDPPIPTDVAAWRSGLDTLSVTIGPFLAIYSVWGMVGDEISGLFVANAKNYGVTATARYSIDLSDTRFYVLMSIGTWAVRQVVLGAQRLGRQRARARGHGGIGFGLTFLGVLLEGLWVYLLFVLAGIVVGNVRDWLTSRVAAGWLAEQWVRLTDLLPVILHIDLPEVIRSLVSWVGATLLPAASHGLLLPLLWLALTATVFGWRDLRLRDIAAVPMLRRTTSRFAPDGSLGLAGRVVKMGSNDLRTKYLPAATSLRMLLRSGPRLLGAYLVLATLLVTGSSIVESLVRVVIGPVGVDRWSQTEPFVGLAIGSLFTPVLIALYAATFERCLSVVPAASVPIRDARLS